MIFHIMRRGYEFDLTTEKAVAVGLYQMMSIYIYVYMYIYFFY